MVSAISPLSWIVAVINLFWLLDGGVWDTSSTGRFPTVVTNVRSSSLSHCILVCWASDLLLFYASCSQCLLQARTTWWWRFGQRDNRHDGKTQEQKKVNKMSKHQVCIRDRRVMFLQRRLMPKQRLFRSISHGRLHSNWCRSILFIILQETCQLSLLPTWGKHKNN